MKHEVRGLTKIKSDAEKDIFGIQSKYEDILIEKEA